MQIEDGEIYATINQKDGMVRFHDNPEMYNNVAMLMKLDSEVSSKNKDRNVEMCYCRVGMHGIGLSVKIALMQFEFGVINNVFLVNHLCSNCSCEWIGYVGILDA